MKTIKDFNTDGVLVLANTTKLKGRFEKDNFNYDYPEGLADVIKDGIVHIITTEGDVKAANFTLDRADIDPEKWKLLESNNYLNVEEGDVVRLFAHGDFTRTCDWKGGDHDAYIEDSPFDKKQLLKRMPKIDIPAGYYKVNVFVKTKIKQYSFPHFIFLLEPSAAASPETITLNPIEYYT